MTKLFKRGVLAGSVLVLAANGVFAQSSTSSDTDKIDQIIVTGARTPIELSQIGSATTVITRNDIETRQARYVSDLLRAVPGFAISHTGVVGSQTQVRVRGSEANHVLVLIDGVRANDPATGDEFRWEHLSTANIERIEIIRGPQSALWGSDAIGAVVHVITRGEPGQRGVNIYAESGSNSTTNLGASGVAQLGDWSLSGNLESYSTDGENISREGDELDGSDLATGSLGLRYASASQVTFDASLRVMDATSETDAIDFVVTGLPTDADLETRSDSVSGNVGGSFVAHDDRVTYSYALRYFDSEHRNYADDVEASSTASERVSLLAQSDISLGDNQLSLALEHEDTDFQQRGSTAFGDPNQDQGMAVSSAVAEYQHLSHDRLTWILGARFDKHSEFDDALTARGSLAWQWTERTRLRASIGSGHKTPTFTERFGFFPDQFVGNPDLKPETSTSYDIGLDQEFLDGALTLQASLYAQELKDEINGFVFDPVTFLATAENSGGKSERSGAELAANWRLSSQFSAALSYTYTDAKEDDPSGNKIRELRRPRHTGSASFAFTSGNERFTAALSADYGGTREDIFFPPWPDPSETVTLSDYWLVDLTANLRLTENVTLFVRGTNLLDEDYEQVYGFRTPGRAGYVGVRAGFGR
jgi:vitamin B12 transporter